MVALVALLGAAFGLGLTAAVASLIPTIPVARRRPVWATGIWWREAWRQVATRAGTAVAVAAVVGVVTRWPIGALLAGIASYVLPVVLGRTGTPVDASPAQRRSRCGPRCCGTACPPPPGWNRPFC